MALMRPVFLIATAALVLSPGCAGPEIARRKWVVAAGVVHDGERPRFPLEVYSIKTDSDYRIARFMGFDAVCDDGPRAFTFSRKYGMMLTVPNWFGRDTTEDSVRGKARAFQGHESIIAWNLADEPDLRPQECPPEALARFARIVREEDPHRLVSVTLSGARGAHRLWEDYASAADVLRLDPYPVAEGASFQSMRERLTLGRRLAGNAKSLWVVLQAWRGERARLPTPGELRLSAYLALVERTRGLSVFDFNLDTWAGDAQFLEALLRVMAEARSIRSLAAAGKSFKVTAGAADVAGREWVAAGRRLLALVNVGDEAHTIDLATRALGFVRIEAGSVFVHRSGVPPVHENSPWDGALPPDSIFDADASVYPLPDPGDGRLLLRNASDVAQEITVSDTDARFYVCDLHGDRWHRLAPDQGGLLLLPAHATVEAVTPRTQFASPSEAAFVRGGLSITLTGGDPLHETLALSLKRHRIRAGDPLVVTCVVTGDHDARLDAKLLRYDTPIENAVMVERIPGEREDGARFTVTVNLAGGTPSDVDLELRLELSWRLGLSRRRVCRTIRIRPDKVAAG